MKKEFPNQVSPFNSSFGPWRGIKSLPLCLYSLDQSFYGHFGPKTLVLLMFDELQSLLGYYLAFGPMMMKKKGFHGHALSLCTRDDLLSGF